MSILLWPIAVAMLAAIMILTSYAFLIIYDLAQKTNKHNSARNTKNTKATTDNLLPADGSQWSSALAKLAPPSPPSPPRPPSPPHQTNLQRTASMPKRMSQFDEYDISPSALTRKIDKKIETFKSALTNLRQALINECHWSIQ
jgi:hypothetical protein